MRKVLSLFLSLALAAGLMSVSAFAADIETLEDKGSLSLSVGTGDVYPGGTVEVTVALADSPGVAGVKFQLDYNADVFTLRGAESNGSVCLTDGYLEIGPDGIIWADGENLYDDTKLVKLIFDVSTSAATGDYTIGFKANSVSGGHAAVTNGVKHELYVDFVLGDAATVTITEPEYNPGDVNMDNGVNVSDLQDLLLHINGEELLTGTGFLLGDLDNNGVINVSDLQSLLLHLNGEELLY